MSVSALSAESFCAEQKIVPLLPTRKLSRVLSGAAAGADAVMPKQETAAAIAIAVLRILPSKSEPCGEFARKISAAGDRLFDLLVEPHLSVTQRVDQEISDRLAL